MSFRGIHFEKELLIPANRLHTTDFPAAEKERLDALCADADFFEAITRRDQIAVAQKPLRSFRAGHRMTFEEIGPFFRVSPAIIRKQMQSAKTPPKFPRQKSILSNEQKLWNADLVNSRTEQRKPIAHSEFLDLLGSQHQGVLCANTLGHVIRNMDLVKTIVGPPMEAKRVVVSPDEISEWFDRLSSLVDSIPREFAFNMDENGSSDDTDSREVRVLARIAYPEPWIAVPSERHSKRSTFVACIAADGLRMRAFVILPRVTAEKEFKYDGCDESNDVLAF
jgi:hypothetical protein